MSYNISENPSICGTIYYYDSELFDNGSIDKDSIIEIILRLISKYNYLDITNIEIGKNEIKNHLLKNCTSRFSKKQIESMSLQSIIKQCIDDKNVTYISLSHTNKKEIFFWEISWHMNFEFPDGTPKNKYNHMTLSSSYDRLNSSEKQKEYIMFFNDLANALNAFYGTIEDVSTSADILEQSKEKCFTEKYIQAIYWGNYFGNKLCSDIGWSTLSSIPYVEKIESPNGFFFALTNNLFDSKNNPNYKARNKILKYFHSYLKK